MAVMTLTRARWQCWQGLRAVGLSGGVALALALLCALGSWRVVEPLRSEAARLDAESAALERRWAARSAANERAPATPQQQLAAFDQRFPNEQGIAPALRLLQSAARRHHVALDQAEFRFSREPTELLARYAILLPIKADYRALRRFTRDALRELPGLALEEVNLRRSDPKSPLLEAQMRFVLFVATPSKASVASAAAPSN